MGDDGKARKSLKIYNDDIKNARKESRLHGIHVTSTTLLLFAITLGVNFSTFIDWENIGILFAVLPPVASFGVIMPAYLIDVTIKSNKQMKQFEVMKKEFTNHGFVDEKKATGEVRKTMDLRKKISKQLDSVRSSIISKRRLAAMWVSNITLFVAFEVAVAWTFGYIHIKTSVVLFLASFELILLSFAVARWTK